MGEPKSTSPSVATVASASPTDPLYAALIEALAALVHDKMWAGWMRWVFQNGRENMDGSFTLYPERVARWARQISTSYYLLPDAEQESDRVEARRILDLISRHVWRSPDERLARQSLEALELAMCLLNGGHPDSDQWEDDHDKLMHSLVTLREELRILSVMRARKMYGEGNG